MTGYQEILTDPSYHGQIVTMTATQIGNTGINDEDSESARPWVAGLSSERSRCTSVTGERPGRFRVSSRSTASLESRESTRATWCATFAILER